MDHVQYNLRFRKGVSALILNKENKFLLVNLQSFEEKFYAVPGGGVENSETLEEAVYREIEEELGIKKVFLEYLSSSKEPHYFKFKTKKLFRDGMEYDGSERYFFGFRFTGNDSDIVLQESEVRDYAWVAYGELKDFLLFQNQQEETVLKIHELFPMFKKEVV